MRKKIEVRTDALNQRNLDLAVQKAKEQKDLDPKKSIHEIMQNEDVKDLLLDILDRSNMSAPQKSYIKAILIDRMPETRALRKAFGRDLGYQAEAIQQGIMQNPAVKEFMDMVHTFYIRVVPVAAVKEVEVLMTSHNEKNILEAAKSIKASAGIATDQGKRDLPVQIVINMPNARGAEVVDGEVKIEEG